MVTGKHSKIRPSAAATAILLLALATLAAANATGIYRWVDAEGTVHFGDSPPAERGAEPVEIRPSAGDAPQAGEAESVPGQPMAPDAETGPGEEAADD